MLRLLTDPMRMLMGLTVPRPSPAPSPHQSWLHGCRGSMQQLMKQRARVPGHGTERVSTGSAHQMLSVCRLHGCARTSPGIGGCFHTALTVWEKLPEIHLIVV